MIGLLTGRAGLWAVAILAIMAACASIYWMGGREARRERDDLRDEITTDRRMDNAGEGFRYGNDAHVDDWLRRYGQ